MSLEEEGRKAVFFLDFTPVLPPYQEAVPTLLNVVILSSFA